MPVWGLSEWAPGREAYPGGVAREVRIDGIDARETQVLTGAPSPQSVTALLRACTRKMVPSKRRYPTDQYENCQGDESGRPSGPLE
jgi:hypothetical protein